MTEAPMLVRLLFQTTAMLAVLGFLLLGAAGDWRWVEAWLFLLLMGAVSVGAGAWLARSDPALLESRLSSPFAVNQAQADRTLIVAIAVGFLAWMGMMGMDHRFGWSRVPVAGEVLGVLLILAGYAGVLWTFSANSFAAPQIRLQADRGQHVIDTGPYALVRHPMYSGGALYVFGTALLLGSWWGSLGAALLAATFGLRALREEAMLRNGLSGYDNYARRVRYRLLPGVW